MAVTEALRRVPLFADLDKRELESIAKSMRERTFNPGQTIATEGSSGVGFFVIDDGRAKVSVGGEERAELGPGDYFGEIALIGGTDRTATVTAETELHCYGLSSWEFRPMVEHNAALAWKLLQALAKRMHSIEQRG